MILFLLGTSTVHSSIVPVMYCTILLYQIKYYFIVRPKVDQRAGQLCLPHIGITKIIYKKLHTVYLMLYKPTLKNSKN